MAGYLWQMQFAYVKALFLCVAFAAITDGQEGAVFSADLTKLCEMIVQMCSSVYKRELNDGRGSDERVCSMLRSYKLCLERSASSCIGKVSYDTLTTVISSLLSRLCLELKNKRELER